MAREKKNKTFFCATIQQILGYLKVTSQYPPEDEAMTLKHELYDNDTSWNCVTRY